jgi:hypothetical protein
MKQEVLCDREDFRSIEEELKQNFIRNVLMQMNIPMEEIWPEDKLEFSAEDKIKLREMLNKLDVLILDDRDGGLKIIYDNEVVAEWKKSRYELHTDKSKLDPSKRIYTKIFLDYWSMFEEKE